MLYFISRTVEVPSSRIVIIEGIYALSERLRPLLDLRVSVTGGVHLDLIKRVIRDIQRAGQEPQEIIHQISETVHALFSFPSFISIYKDLECICGCLNNFSIYSVSAGISNVQGLY